MKTTINKTFAVLAIVTCWANTLLGAAQDQTSNSFRVMTWNIWHGGREDGEEIGPQRVAEVIKESGADIVAMQETYGSGQLIAKALGFQFQPTTADRKTNLSIHSRFPIVEDISVFEKFKCHGGLIELPDKSKIAFYSIWLPYKEDIWIRATREKYNELELANKCDVSRDDLVKIHRQIQERLSDKKYAAVPIIIAGDFNSMSHLDYTQVNRDQYQHVVNWPTSRVLTDAGFRDAYRETNPIVNRKKDSTWSPKFVEQEQDRIDFVYYKSNQWRAASSKAVRTHRDWFPSDHAAVVAEFRRKTDLPGQQSTINIATYNIRRGHGTDSQDFLMRSAEAIKRMDVDVVALQEIDNRCKRSGKVNQAAQLGRSLNMQSAFAPFMNHDGGKYGLATLSRLPVIEEIAVKLPDGREPRTALVTKVRLPNDQSVLVVNIHLDWVDDDSKRFEQANAVADFLKQQKLPWVLLGDFNDVPKSRTLKLFREIGKEVRKEGGKESGQQFTYSSDKPSMEIDYIFVWPENRWQFESSKVIDEKITSDHLPVFATLNLVPPTR